MINDAIFYIIALALSFALCSICTAIMLPRLRAWKVGQKILEIGPVWHAKKEGTPTMGGLSFLLILPIASTLLLPFLKDNLTGDALPLYIITLIFCLANGAIGIIDDITKFRRQQNEGLSPTQKLVLQITLSAGYLILLRLYGVLDDRLHLSFLGQIPLGFSTYFVLMLLLLGMINCANLTDGIDGLATSVATVIFSFYTLLSVHQQLVGPALLSVLMLGCALAFFFFNRHPARIFMGDTGSLFFGAAAVSIPLLLGNHLLPILSSVIYVIEGISVILQVLYFKLTGKRLFLMAPIHHHFEKCGWSENKIVLTFATVSALACLLAWFLP